MNSRSTETPSTLSILRRAWPLAIIVVAAVAALALCIGPAALMPSH